MPWLKSDDVSRWREGRFFDSYTKLGAHANRAGTWFAVWAPHADSVAVIGDFNDWDPERDLLRRIDEAGLWEGYVRGAAPGQHYKYRVTRGRHVADKSDPYAAALEAPATEGNPIAGLSSIIHTRGYAWSDEEWMRTRRGPDSLDGPLSVYEVHLGSWRRSPDGGFMSYREVAEPLADYVTGLGFTHVELLPVLEHPYYASWGYQVVGYFAPSHRYGDPDGFRFLVDHLHQRGVGVILDWVPAHFATDAQGLVFFDGSTLYEYDDPIMRHHPDWGTLVFDYTKPGVRNFLVSNACYWIDEFHIDGLRFDAVASMLYRDYSRDTWSPNEHGGRENLEAVDLLRTTSRTLYERFPDVLMIAEESTAWPSVTAPVHHGGLGFLYKWNMGWMHDTLSYMRQDPIHRKHHLDDFTFPLVYAWSENYMLPLSHDEVVHGKGSLWGKMPGDPWQKAANLRLLLAHQWGHPGKVLLFMGGEFGQPAEWNHDTALQWELLDQPLHAGIKAWVVALNALYADRPALWNDRPGGFEWIDFSDQAQTVASYVRREADDGRTGPAPGEPVGHEDESGGDMLVFVFNFTPIPREAYRVGLPRGGTWEVVLNSNDGRFGGSGAGTTGTVKTRKTPCHGRPDSTELRLPPLGVLVLARSSGA